MPEEQLQVYKEDLEWGELYYTQLNTAPFPHYLRQEGNTIGGVYYPYHPHYSNSAVGIFVPRGFRPGNKIDLVFYFHGNLETIATAPAKFNLYKQFFESGVNALLVMPETVIMAPDNFGGKLEEPGGFQRLVEDIMAYVSGAGLASNGRLGRIILTGHSGAHQVMARILDTGDMARHIREVILFDALYSEVEIFVRWVGLFKSRLAVVYAEGGTTAEKTQLFMKLLRPKIWRTTETSDDPATDLNSVGGKVVVLSSSYDHWGLQFKARQFERLLASSRVLKRRTGGN